MSASASNEPAAAGPRTLRRGLAVLALLRDAGSPLTVTELARDSGLRRPTLYRLLAALEEAGWARRRADGPRYEACLVRPAAGESLAVEARVRAAEPAMKRLADQLGDAVFLVVREGEDSLSLHREIGSHPVQILATYAGKRQPLGVGSGGMAILAALADDVIEPVLAANAGRLQEYGGLTVQEMRRLIDNTRARGYAVMGNRAVHGAIGVGCALCDAAGQPLLALSVTGVVQRMPLARQREIAALIRQELLHVAAGLAA